MICIPFLYARRSSSRASIPLPSPTFLRGITAKKEEEDADEVLQEIHEIKAELLEAEQLEAELEAADAEDSAEERDWHRGSMAKKEDEAMLDQEEGE